MLFRYSSDTKGKAVKKALVYTKNEHGIPRDHIDPEAIKIISHLRNNGYEAYIVGGAVRDLLIGKKPKDFDIVTSAEPAKIKRLFRNSRIIGKRFRLVHIFFTNTFFEVSTFRSLVTGTTGNSFGTMDDDVKRRDFTLNALYYDPIKEQVIDYVGGVKDIRAKKLKEVIPLSVIFKDDPVRMLRAIKYAVITDATVPFLLKRAIKKNSFLLQTISPSRLTEELVKICNSGKACDIINYALMYDLFMYIQPQASALIDNDVQFSHVYEQSLIALDDLVNHGAPCDLGRKLVYLIRDFIELILPDSKNPSEIYKVVYAECRRFIMPMNPPRIELEFAVKWVLKDLGINVRPLKSREKKSYENKGKEIRAKTVETGNLALEAGFNPLEEKKKTSKKRRKPVNSAST